MALLRCGTSGGGGETPKDYYIFNNLSVGTCEMGEYVLGTRLNNSSSGDNTVSIDVCFAEPKNIRVSNSNTSTLTLYNADGTNRVVGTSGGTMNNCIGVSAITSNAVWFDCVEVV